MHWIIRHLPLGKLRRRALFEIAHGQRPGDFRTDQLAHIARDAFAQRALQFLADDVAHQIAQHFLVEGAVVVIVIVDEEPDVTDVGLNDAVAPAGRPLAVNDTDCALPAVVAVETVVEVEPPAVTAPDVGFSDTEKSLAGATHPGRVNDAARVFQLKVPLAPRYSDENQNVQSSLGSMLIDV